MSETTKQNGRSTDEEQNAWHGLPAMIGEAIVNQDYGVHHWGGYLVERDSRGDIVIYRTLEHAEARDGLENEGDKVADMWDYVVSGEEIGRIEAPEEEWSSEVEVLPEDIFDGWD